MAITAADAVLWRELRRLGLIPERPTVLEIGRANWYYDIPVNEILDDLKEFAEHEDQRRIPTRGDGWQIADWYYDFMLRRPIRTAIDLDKDANRRDDVRVIEHDLNYAPNTAQHEIVINTGTTEHIFSQERVFNTIHRATKPGGLMVHCLPLWGWLDHGFYNYNPTFVVDLAHANRYEIVCWYVTEIQPLFAKKVESCEDVYAIYKSRGTSKSAMMQVCFRRPDGNISLFDTPMQGIYSRPSAQEYANWIHRR